MKYSRAVHVTSTVVDGEVVMLNLQSGQYYALTQVSAEIWNMLAEPCTVDQLTEHILNTYDAPKARVEKDLKEVLQDFLEQGLIQEVPT